MKKKDLIEALAVFPDDFQICLSGYLKIDKEALDKVSEENEGSGESKKDADPEDEVDDDLIMVIDHPIIGLASNGETKEIRFVVEGTSLDVLQEVDGEMKVLQELEKKEEEDDDSNAD